MFDLLLFRDDLRDSLGVDEDDLPDEKADRFINRSYSWLLDEFKFRTKEKSVIFVTTISERNYDLPDDFESLRGLSIEDPIDKQHTPLDRMTTDEYESKYRADSSEEAKPTHYVREGVCVRLWPTPEKEYRMTLKYNVILPLLDSTDHLLPAVPQSWEEMILFGAQWRALIVLGDIPRSTAISQLVTKMARDAIKKVNEGREEADSHRAGLEPYIPPYEV